MFLGDVSGTLGALRFYHCGCTGQLHDVWIWLRGNDRKVDIRDGGCAYLRLGASSKAILRAGVAARSYTELGFRLNQTSEQGVVTVPACLYTALGYRRNPFLVETYLRIAVSAHRINNIRCERTTLSGLLSSLMPRGTSTIRALK